MGEGKGKGVRTPAEEREISERGRQVEDTPGVTLHLSDCSKLETF